MTSSGPTVQHPTDVPSARAVLAPEALDCGGRLDHVVGYPRAWTRDDVRPEHWEVSLPAAARAEIVAVAAKWRAAPLPLLLLSTDDFALDACRDVMADVKRRINAGVGLALVEALPMEELSDDEATAAYWLLGQFLARPVATKWDGTMVYHVTDTGKRFGHGVRGSATNVELSFHTDNAFGVMVPDYVGLLCLRPAATGGESRFCSLYEVHNRMLTRHRRLLDRLYRPAYYDRQAEHAADAPAVLWAPLFHYRAGRLTARLTPNLVRRGYDLAGAEMDSELADALAALEEVVAEDDLRIEFTLARGEMQYVDNLGYGHFRAAFTDDPDPSRKRHLLRVWHRDHGRRTYDGS